MNQQWNRNENFRNEIGYPSKEFDIPEDYDKQREEEIIQHRETPKENNPTSDQTPQTQEKQPEPTPEGASIKEEPRITELPTEAPRRQSGSRELKNLKSNLDGDSWKPCSTDHGRRMRVRAVDFKEEDEFTETHNNVRQLGPEEDTNLDEPVEKRD